MTQTKLGSFLISGNGYEIGHKAVKQGWALSITISILLFIFFFVIMSDAQPRSQSTIIFVFIALIAASEFITYFLLIKPKVAIRDSRIDVYENGLEINAIERNRTQSSLQSMQLLYAEVRNVSLVENGGLAIHTSYSEFVCYADNNHRIRDIIIEKLMSKQGMNPQHGLSTEISAPSAFCIKCGSVMNEVADFCHKCGSKRYDPS